MSAISYVAEGHQQSYFELLAVLCKPHAPECRVAFHSLCRTHLLKILRVSMMSLKETKFSIRQCSLILLPVEVVSGSERCKGCPAALMPSGMLAAVTCTVKSAITKAQHEVRQGLAEANDYCLFFRCL